MEDDFEEMLDDIEDDEEELKKSSVTYLDYAPNYIITMKGFVKDQEMWRNLRLTLFERVSSSKFAHDIYSVIGSNPSKVWISFVKPSLGMDSTSFV